MHQYIIYTHTATLLQCCPKVESLWKIFNPLVDQYKKTLDRLNPVKDRTWDNNSIPDMIYKMMIQCIKSHTCKKRTNFGLHLCFHQLYYKIDVHISRILAPNSLSGTLFLYLCWKFWMESWHSFDSNPNIMLCRWSQIIKLYCS